MQKYLFSSMFNNVFGSNVELNILNFLLLLFILFLSLNITLYLYTPKKFRLKYKSILIEPTFGLEIDYKNFENFILINSKLIKPSLFQKIFKINPKVIYSIKSTINGLSYIISYPALLESSIKSNIKAFSPYIKYKKIKHKEINSSITKLEYKFDFTKIQKSDNDLHIFKYLCNSITVKKKNEQIEWQVNTYYTHKNNKTNTLSRVQYKYQFPFNILLKIINKIKNLIFKLFYNLKYLVLGSNHIPVVDERTLICELSLKTIGLSAENISNLKATLISVISGIDNFSKLEFKDNNWQNNLKSKIQLNLLPLNLITELFYLSDEQYNLVEIIRLSRILPLPIYLKNKKNLDLKLGKYDYSSEKANIGITQEERLRHVYIVGGTGSGKSTLLKYALSQDIKNKQGFALIDPHGDLAASIINLIPKSRHKDLIYFNPVDISFPISINLLEQNKNLSGDQKLLEQDLITEQIISIFRKLFSKDDYGGNRLEHILRNAVQTAFIIENSTIFTVYRLLIDNKYRFEILPKIKDKTLLSFWQNEYGSAGGMQRVKLSIGITSKISRFLRPTITRRILGQPKSSLNFNDVIENKKILICNLSKGLIGEDNSFILGATIMAKLQLAIYAWAKIREVDRSPFYIYVDEFQDFATSSFLQLLSEGRKYKLGLILAEQSLSQQSRSYASNILANVGTTIAFRSSSPLDEKLLLPLFSSFLLKGDLLNLESYNFYIRMSAINVYPPTIAKTVLINKKEINNQKLIKLSRENFSYNSSILTH